MHKSLTSQTMGSGGGGIFSSSSSNGYSICSHSSQNGSNTSVVATNVKCDCTKCTYCQQPLGTISVKCSDCVNFHLCLKCFSMSAEIGDHKKDHNYFLKSTVSFPLFDSEKLWTYKEELHLLQFIEQYGFDNWEEIGKHLPNRTAKECMQHYHSYYIYGNLGKNTFTNNLKNKLESITGNSLYTNGYSPAMDEFKIEDPTLDDKSEMNTTVLLPPIEMSAEEQRALGYMPLRDDFEREYKNDGEVLLSNLNIANNQLALLNNSLNDKTTGISSQVSSTPSKQEANSIGVDSDDIVDFELKLTLMEMYRECLQERQRFKKIAREYGLVNNASALLNKQKVIHAQQQGSGVLLAPNGLSFNHVSNKKRIKKNGLPIGDYKEMSEVNEKLKKYAQFMSVSDYETLIDNLRKQREICKKIQELQTYRTHYGLQKLADIGELKKEQLSKTPLVKTRKRKRKSYQMYADSPNKRLTRRQNNSILYNSMTNGSANNTNNKLDSTLNDTNLTDLNISNIRNFSPASSTNSSRSSSTNRSRSNSRSNSSNSMNMYELVDRNKTGDPEDLISDDQEDDAEDMESENDENLEKDQIFTDEDENENSEDLSSGGAASSGGSGINEPNIGVISNNNKFGRRLRALNNRRNNSLLIKNKKKKSKKLNLSLNTTSSSSKKMLNASLNKSNLKRTNMLLKSAKSPNGINCNNKLMSKKIKLLDFQRGVQVTRSERLCSMPGYNLLSENEKKLISSIDLKPSDYINFKTNLIKTSLAHRKHKTVNDQITSYFKPDQKFSNSPAANLNETSPNPSSTPNQCKVKSMMLRRHSLNGNETENGTSENSGNSYVSNSTSIPENSINDSPSLTLNSSATSSKRSTENSKLMSILMKTTCPKYFQIPKSSRKRILRFLCDNGWIDVS